VEVRSGRSTGLAEVTHYLTSLDRGTNFDSIGNTEHVSVEEIRSISHSETNTITSKFVRSFCVELGDCSVCNCVEKVSFFGNDVNSEVLTIVATWCMPGVFVAAQALYGEH